MEGVQGSPTGSNETDTVECPYCAEQIKTRARKCRHCGETVDVAMRIAEEALRASERQGQGNVYMNAGGGAASSAAAVGNAYDYRRPYKSRTVAILLAIFLGGIGGHKFYLDRAGFGILYLLFCWTLIPGFVALIEAIRYLLMGEERFHLKYG